MCKLYITTNDVVKVATTPAKVLLSHLGSAWVLYKHKIRLLNSRVRKYAPLWCKQYPITLQDTWRTLDSFKQPFIYPKVLKSAKVEFHICIEDISLNPKQSECSDTLRHVVNVYRILN